MSYSVTRYCTLYMEICNLCWIQNNIYLLLSWGVCKKSESFVLVSVVSSLGWSCLIKLASLLNISYKELFCSCSWGNYSRNAHSIIKFYIFYINIHNYRELYFNEILNDQLSFSRRIGAHENDPSIDDLFVEPQGHKLCEDSSAGNSQFVQSSLNFSLFKLERPQNEQFINFIRKGERLQFE